MITLLFKPAFVKRLNRLDKGLLSEVLEKIELFKDFNNHEALKVHKLHGVLSGCYSFSVDYQTRIVFQYLSKKEAVFVAIGDHDIYK